MEFQQLGRSALKVSRIGFGCMSLDASREVEGMGLIHRAIERGINFFDTADLYDQGENERLLGKAIGGSRDKLVIATKVGNQWRADGSGWDWNPSKAYILKSVEDSLRRLNTDRIDLYQLHGGTIEDRIDETIDAFEDLKKQGKIICYGISSIRPNVIREYVSRSSIDSVMMQYSLLDRRPEEATMDLLCENEISVLARGSVAQGLLINKPAKEYLGHDSTMVKWASELIRSLSSDVRTLAQTALKYVLQQPRVTSAIVGVSGMKQLEDAAATFSTPALIQEEIDLLTRSIPARKYEAHR